MRHALTLTLKEEDWVELMAAVQFKRAYLDRGDYDGGPDVDVEAWKQSLIRVENELRDLLTEAQIPF